MRVAVVAEQLRRRNPGGIGTYARELSRAVVRSAHEVELVASRGAGDAEPVDVGAPVSVTRFGHRLTTTLWNRDLLRLDAGVAARNDVLHATSFHYPSPPRRRGQTSPALTVFVHDLAWRANPAHFSHRGAKFHEAALARSVRLADRLLVPSNRTADALIADGVPAPRIEVIHEGCDHLPPPRTQRVHRFTDTPFLLTVSTLEPRKNLPLLLRAYAAACGRLPPSIERPRLVIVGAMGWNGRSEALPNSIPAGVEIIGSIDDQDLSDLLADAVGFVYVPTVEGFGLPPLEAMRAGLACVVSQTVPSVTETSGESAALLVDPHDEAGVAVALGRLMTDDDLRAYKSRMGSEFAAVRTWAKTASEHLPVWAELVDSSGRAR
jgi:glycosyltransferase involved in cell wall biosynthesis